MVKKANLQKLEDVTLKMKSHFAITVFLRNVFFFLFPLGIPNRWEVHTKWQVNVCSNPKVIKIMWYMIKSFRKVTKKKDFSIGFFWRLDQNFDIVYIWLQWLERLRLWTTGIRWETRVWRGTDVRKEKKDEMKEEATWGMWAAPGRSKGKNEEGSEGTDLYKYLIQKHGVVGVWLHIPVWYVQAPVWKSRTLWRWQEG